MARFFQRFGLFLGLLGKAACGKLHLLHSYKSKGSEVILTFLKVAKRSFSKLLQFAQIYACIFSETFANFFNSAELERDSELIYSILQIVSLKN
jgi:hypothetical protein